MPERIKPSTSPLADNAAPLQQKPARVGGKFVKRVPLTPVAQAAQQRAEEEQSLEVMAIEPKGKAKKVRKPFGRQEAKLAYPARPGFSRRWFNDDPGRVQRAMDAGYILVTENNKPVTFPSGVNKQGLPRVLHLMEIPQEFFDEDFAAKQEALDEVDRTIYTGHHNEEPGDGRYVPKSIPITVGVRRGPGSG